MSAELRAATKDLNDFAKTAQSKGLTDELRTGMLAAGDAVAKTKNQIGLLDGELKSLKDSSGGATAAQKAFIDGLKEQVATQDLSQKQMLAYKAEQLGVSEAAQPLINSLKLQEAHAISSRAATESLVLVHEALSGRYTRMTGSAMILTQALAGQEAVTSALSVIMSPIGATIAGLAVISIGAALATSRYEAEQTKLTAATLGLGAASGLTVEQLRAAGSEAASWSGRSVAASTESATAFAEAGVRSEQTVKALSGDVEIFAQLTGQEAAGAQKELAEAMHDPVKGAQDLNDKLGILDSTTLEHIRTLADLGDKEGAVTTLVQALQGRMDDAKASGVGLTGEFHEMVASLGDLASWLGRVNGELAQFSVLGARFGSSTALFQGEIDNQRAQAAFKDHLLAEMNQASAKGRAAYDGTPEGRDQQQRENLAKGIADATQALIADTAVRGEHSDAVKQDRETLDEYNRAYLSFLPAAEKASRISAIDVKLAEARHAHNKDLIEDLTRQKSLLEQRGEVKSWADVNTEANNAAAKAGASDHEKKVKGPSVVEQWAEQLHAAEIESNDFFTDQTARELAFWQSKIGLTRTGSKEWIEVQSKIYEASKTLAHQDYQDKIADLNEKLQADRGNWAAEQSDWKDKLAFIASKYKEQSTEYKNAFREFEAAERQHQQQMLQEQRNGESRALQALKSHLSAMQQESQIEAQTAKAAAKAQSEGKPFGNVSAALADAQIDEQLLQQKIANATTAYQREDELRQQEIARDQQASLAKIADEQTRAEIVSALQQGQYDKAEELGARDVARYKAAVQAKSDADQQYYDQSRNFQAQWQNQTIQSILTVSQAYHSYVDGIVGATSSGLVGLVGRTQTWQQAVLGIYNSLLNNVSSILTKLGSNWVVEHIFMSAQQREQLAIQRAAWAASEGAKTASTTAGTATRTAVDTAATARSTALETTSTAAHARAETAKTGATSAGAATRSATESSGFFTKILSMLGISVGAHSGAEVAKTGATTAGAATRATAENTAATATTAAQMAENAVLAMSYAAVAGAAGTASYAGAPWPVDMGAPAFGAAMYANAAAYASMASLAVGTNAVPNDMIAQIHAGERIIPAADNARLLQMVGTAANAGEAASRNDIHLHYAPQIHERERLDIKRLLASGSADLITFIHQAVRDKKLKLQPA